jgi:hypothetical protein
MTGTGARSAIVERSHQAGHVGCSTWCYTRLVPTKHRRIGLVVDDELESVVRSLAEVGRPEASEASVVRRAVIRAAAVEQLLAAADVDGEDCDAIVSALVALRQALELAAARAEPASFAQRELAAAIARRLEGTGRGERRRRQIEFLDGAVFDEDDLALRLREELDGFDPLRA